MRSIVPLPTFIAIAVPMFCIGVLMTLIGLYLTQQRRRHTPQALPCDIETIVREHVVALLPEDDEFQEQLEGDCQDLANRTNCALSHDEAVSVLILEEEYGHRFGPELAELLLLRRVYGPRRIMEQSR